MNFDMNDGNNSGGMVFDLGAAEETSFECMPKGDYECTVDNVEFTESKAGAPMFKMTYKVCDGGDYDNRTLFDYIVIGKPEQPIDAAKAETAQKIGRAKLKKFVMLTTPSADMSAFNPQDYADTGEAVGMPLKVNVGINTYQGEKRNNVKSFKASTADGGFLGM